jgi:hypothetical protein
MNSQRMPSKRFSATLDQLRAEKELSELLQQPVIVCKFRKNPPKNENNYGITVEEIPQSVKNIINGNITRCIRGELKCKDTPLEQYISACGEYHLFRANVMYAIDNLPNTYYARNRHDRKALCTIFVKKELKTTRP